MNTARATSSTTTEQPWRGIFFRGPAPVKKQSGKEVSCWTVFQGDNEARPKGRVYEVSAFEKADSLARAMSHDRNLELINEASPA